MTNKKIELGMMAVAMLTLFASGCKTVTTAPIFYSNNTHYDFIILGEVTYESSAETGFQELLQAARIKYPSCDYVIDVMVDSKTTTTKFFYMQKAFTIYTMRGTAIQYTQTVSAGQPRPAQAPAAGAGTAANTGAAAPARVDGYTVTSITGRASRRDSSGTYVVIREGESLTEDTVVRIDSGSLVLTRNGTTVTIPASRMGRLAELIARL